MGTTAQVNCRIDSDLKKKFNAFCQRERITQSQAFATALLLLNIDKFADNNPEVKAEIDSFVRCTNMMVEKYTHVMHQFVDEKTFGSETHKAEVRDLEEKIIQLEKRLREAESQVEEYKKNASAEKWRADHIEKEKEMTIREMNNLEETHKITLKKIQNLEDKAQKADELEKEIKELKTSEKAVNDRMNEMTRDMLKVSKLYYSNQDEKIRYIKRLETHIDILETQLKNAGVDPIQLNNE